ncbi:MAG TPA: hypothetical protein VF432_28225 [Thermoanaerobaculia bacterium]
MRKLVLSLLVVVCLAVSAHAAEPFVVLVDEERDLLLIPEGTAVPMGIEFSFTSDADPEMLALKAAGGEGAAPRHWVYAYAAPERFVEARRRIAEAEAKSPQPSAEMVLAGERSAVGMRPGVARPGGRVAANIDNFDQTYYYYFWDGSYHAVRKIIYNQGGGGGWVQYTAYGWVFSAAGDWDTKVVVNNSSNFSYWNQSKTCYFYNADGNCTPAVWTHVNPNYFSASMTSYAVLTRYLYPPCDLPCKSNSTSTATVSVP